MYKANSTAPLHSPAAEGLAVHQPRLPPPAAAARYAGVLLGLSNTAGVLAGVLGTAATGFILQNGSWNQVGAGAGSAVALAETRLLKQSEAGMCACVSTHNCREHPLAKPAP